MIAVKDSFHECYKESSYFCFVFSVLFSELNLDSACSLLLGKVHLMEWWWSNPVVGGIC